MKKGASCLSFPAFWQTLLSKRLCSITWFEFYWSIVFVGFSNYTLSDISSSSETQGQLVGSIKCSWWKFSVRSRRAPGHLLLPNQFQKRLNCLLLIGQKKMVIMSHKKTNSSVSVYLLYFAKFNLLQSIIMISLWLSSSVNRNLKRTILIKFVVLLGYIRM